MGTLLDSISNALQSLGMLGQGQTLSPEDASLGFRQANLILSSNSANRLMLFNVSTRQFVMQANTGTGYSLGPSGTLAPGQTRPTFIESAQVNVTGNFWLPLSILDKKQWDSVRNLGSVADVPEVLWPDYAMPNIVLNFNPAPKTPVPFKLGCWEQLTQFATLFDSVGNAFPPEYEEWIESSLVVRLAPFYDQVVTPDQAARQQRAEANVMTKNAQGLGGALSSSQQFLSPNLGQPLPTGAAPPGAPPQ